MVSHCFFGDFEDQRVVQTVDQIDAAVEARVAGFKGG